LNRTRIARRNRIASRVMLVAFALWQCGAVAHLVLDTHVILPDGSVADLDHRTGEPIRESQGGTPGDNGCPVLNQLTTANTMASQDAVAIVVNHVSQPLADVDRNAVVAGEEDLFRLSPSNSPPAPS
jgi:hypothetical protein